jgi:hypothetical protein
MGAVEIIGGAVVAERLQDAAPDFLRFVQPRSTLRQEALRRRRVFVQPEDQKREGLLRRRFGARRPRIRSHVAENGSRCPAIRRGARLTQSVEPRECDRRDRCFRHCARRYHAVELRRLRM